MAKSLIKSIKYLGYKEAGQSIAPGGNLIRPQVLRRFEAKVMDRPLKTTQPDVIYKCA